jgi:hypothetical protein
MKVKIGDILVVTLILVGGAWVAFVFYVAGSVLLLQRPFAPYLRPV